MAREKSPSQRWIICSYKAEVLHTDHPYISLFCEATSLPPARPQQPSVTLQVLHARFLLALDSKFQTHLESSPHIFPANLSGYMSSLFHSVFLTQGEIFLLLSELKLRQWRKPWKTESWWKCNQNKQPPRSSPSKQQNLATLAMWFWL